ncbi:hypothetical protein EIP91_009194, partial [Steccherinum ochraceum]
MGGGVHSPLPPPTALLARTHSLGPCLPADHLFSRPLTPSQHARFHGALQHPSLRVPPSCSTYWAATMKSRIKAVRLVLSEPVH